MDEFERDWLPLPPEAIAFFAYFSRFEFALKRAGYFKDNADSAAAMPGWNCFAGHLDQPFFDEMKSACDTKEIFDRPPKKQIVKNGGVGWKDMPAPEGTQQLFEAVRRVRNNLFHGEKYPYARVAEPTRDEKLLNACLFILKKALKTCGTQPESSRLRQVFDHFNAPP